VRFQRDGLLIEVLAGALVVEAGQERPVAFGVFAGAVLRDRGAIDGVDDQPDVRAAAELFARTMYDESGHGSL
jgi:hypothetical protein